MIPKYPKTVKIGGKTIKVKVNKESEDFGEYFHDDALIQLGLPALKSKKIFWESLRHEMMEASLYISGIAWGEVYEQEPVVRCLEEIFFPAWDKIYEKHVSGR